jgi:hypothetical protein
LTVQGDLSAYTLSFAGSLAAGAQASTDNRSVTVRLPTLGRQTLQVTATDQQGKVVHSNQMTIHVLDAGQDLHIIRQAFKDILTPGSWDNIGGTLTHRLVVQIPIWPDKTSLNIYLNPENLKEGVQFVHPTNEPINNYADKSLDNSIDIVTYPGHYRLLSNQQIIECGVGDCFYHSIVEGFKRKNRTTTVLELRTMTAQALLAHYKDPGIKQLLLTD